MSKKIFIMPISLLVFFSCMVFAGFKGPDEMRLKGDKTLGDVNFKHHLHQKIASDCNVCHKYFKKKKKGLENAISEKKLKSKYVMNKVCIKCHKKRKSAKLKTGPTSCKKCHIKNKEIKI